MVLCECGCGEEVKEGNRYVRGHHFKGKKHSKKSRKKMSKNQKGKVFTEKHKENLRKAAKGKKLSEEHKKKIGLASKGNKYCLGHKLSEETKEKISIAGKRKKRSEETCAKLSEIAKNRKYSSETRKKLSEIAKNRTYSPETRQKIGKAALGRPKSKETLEKSRRAHKGQIPSAKCGRGKRSFYDSVYQGRICFRSSYEKGYAQWLDNNNMDWLYECETFDLGNTTYLPDFYLIREKKFVEIKGYMSKKAQDKINLFRELYLGETLDILFREDLIEMGVEM